MNKLKVAIAGYGIVGKRRHHYIDQHPNLEVVAVCDQNYDHDFVDGNVHCYTNYHKLLETKDLDILFVCLPNNIAAEVTIAGLERGLHVFCEKPPGRTVEDIRNVIAVESKYPKLKLKYGFNHRYHDSVREALRILKTKELGEIINLRGVYGKSRIIPFSGGWRSERELAGGGILLDQGIHMLDLMRLFCGEFSEVKSFISNDYWKHDVEDNAYALLKSKHCVAMLNSSATQWQHKFALEISLSKGYIELHGILSGSKSYGEEKIVLGYRDEDSDNGQMECRTIKFLQDNSWRDEIFEFTTAILEDKPIESGTSNDALETMKLVYSIYFSDTEWSNKYNILNPNI
ncbi:MAG: Gfo/Idh/MocA family oxidoreductase [Candidatus Pedobacter colombiensis]|uniref:Gfo/Idh/MocA family oxidoreductase n=1 Tax=Candidatus Pedobacter colombiensis TaxID=3121371 RepID=A0AAJ5W804_9SPHI|nr:Gfo/Idh/MocA family oxidoreductase [Pedobacter sp.]WEK19659.1 MAG: Gfo/Idh/MocA family oxidoreductase [Pedobacter sp.]